MADQVFVDIIYGILSRLPVKSLARFRCVCKSWLKYINDPYLRTIHVKEEYIPILIEQIACDNPKKMKISFLRGVQEEPVLELCYKPNRCYDRTVLLGSCNGLVLVAVEHDRHFASTYRFSVINPLSKECHHLPPISIKIRPFDLDFHGPCHAAGIGFDDSTNTLKTVFVIHKNRKTNVICTMVHSWGMRTWRNITQMPAYLVSGGGVSCHGRVHWLTDDLDDWSPIKIVWFDVKTEEFGSTDPPKPIVVHRHWVNVNGDERLAYNQLIEFKGEVGFAYNNPVYIKVWILKQEDWVLQCCFDLPCYYDSVRVRGCWNKDGDILLTYYGDRFTPGTTWKNHNRDRLVVYSLKTGELQEVGYHVPRNITRTLVYRSSLFSINHTLPAATNTRTKTIPFAKSIHHAAPDPFDDAMFCD